MTAMPDPKSLVNEAASTHPHTTQRAANRKRAVNGARHRTPPSDKPRRVESRRHGWVWDARGDPTGGSARYSIIAGRAATDLRLTEVQLRIVLHLGRFNTQDGWMLLDQAELARWLGVQRTTIAEALHGRRRKGVQVSAGLVGYGYVEVASQEETGERFCLYRVVIDRRNDAAGVSAPSDTTPDDVSAASDTTCRLQTDTRVGSQPTPPNPVLYSSRADLDHTRSDPPVAPQGGRRPSSYLPDDWKLPEADRAWALQHAPQLADRIDAEVEAFRDWHSGKRRVDWSARWRTWVREDAKRATRRPAAAAPATGGSAYQDPCKKLSHGGMYGRDAPDLDRSDWYYSTSPAFRARRAELEHNGDEDAVQAMDAAGRVRLKLRDAMRLEEGAPAGPQLIGDVLARGASQRAAAREVAP